MVDAPSNDTVGFINFKIKMKAKKAKKQVKPGDLVESYTTDYHFLHVLRGKDKKYCYIKSHVRYSSSDLWPVMVEQITWKPKKVGVDSLPGVP